MNNYQNSVGERHQLQQEQQQQQQLTNNTSITKVTKIASSFDAAAAANSLSAAVNHKLNISQQQAGNSTTSTSSSLTSLSSTQPLISNSLAIRQEIQRFESVHPSIYAIYDLIDLLPATDAQIAQQIRDHVVCIEDSFVNSQEWTISRAVPDLRLGIVGSLQSGKSALVHRYLTGSYMQEESPEGGRFKKEVFIDGQSYLLLVRDEGGAPEMQFAAWVDAVIFVFSLENEASFNMIYNYYTKLAHFRNGQDLPIILVGTQDAINENNPRAIDDARARKLANDLKRCAYYETCATYGLNVERVFQEACQKILQQRAALAPNVPSRPTTPQGTRLSISSFNYNASNRNSSNNSMATTNGATNTNLPPAYRPQTHTTTSMYMPPPPARNNEFAYSEQQASNHNQKMWAQPQVKRDQPSLSLRRDFYTGLNNENNNITKYKQQQQQQQQVQDDKQLLPPPAAPTTKHLESFSLVPLRESKENSFLGVSTTQKELPTPTSTPTTSRKSRRRSNLFIPSSSKKSEKEAKNSELGSGRSIPIKQGYLYKRSSKSLNKEWKKKYVTLCADGRLTYHPSLHDYMDDVHGKEIPLQYVTVKVPGQKPRGSKSIITNSVLTTSLFSNVLLTAFETLRDPVKSNSSQQTSGDDEGIALSNSNSQTFITNAADNQQQQQQQQQQQFNIKKRHRRVKSSGLKSNEVDDSDGYEFFIVSLDSKQWHFEAANSEERDEWVAAIEQEIFKSLQGIESAKMKPATTSELAAMVAIRTRVPGNSNCVDCDAPNPEWASLNLGVLLCIECSGIHRNLGSHISKVRSLDLDDWPSGHLSVMLAIGNKLANSVWEANKGGRVKPQPQASRDEKEAWVRSKYEHKEFLAYQQNGNPNSTATGQQLIEAVIKTDMRSIISILANANTELVNSTVSSRDVRSPLLLSCAMGNLAIAQLLIWNGANIKHMDHEGRTCLSYARAAHSLATAKSLRVAESATSTSGHSSNTSSTTSSNSSSLLPPTQYNVEETAALVELLTGLGCPEAAPLTASGTLPRRRDTLGTAYEKLMSGVI